MELKTWQEGRDWLTKRGLPNPAPCAVEGYPYHQHFSISECNDCGTKTVIANVIVRSLFRAKIAYLSIELKDVFPSQQNVFLFNQLRVAAGLTGAVDDYCACVFGPDEHDYLEANLALGLYFYWDIALVDETGDICLFVSHDEAIHSFSRTQKAHVRVTRLLREITGAEPFVWKRE